jgi:succinate dehydrogenase hydrophobic anchor subunit
MIKFIKKNWTDPVWSKVFSGIILAALGGVGTLFVAIYKQIPVADIYSQLKSNYVSINYFTLLFVIIIFLSLLIPAILSDVIKFQLKNIKFPSKFKTSSFDLRQFLAGQWELNYENAQQNIRNNEPVTFDKGNQYKIQGHLYFVLTDIDFDEKKKELKWTKTRYPSNQKHSRETLKIIDKKTMEGTDDVGFKLFYSKKNETRTDNIS